MPNDGSLEISSNGKRYARLSLLALGSISSIVTFIVFCAGFIIGYLTFKAEMATVTQQLADVRADNKAMRQTLIEDSARLISLETEAKYISQGIAELKLQNIPKR
jgi:hypothetical protein